MSTEPSRRRCARVTQADVARVLRAVEQTGGGTVEVTPDGTIRILPKKDKIDVAAANVEPDKEIVL